MSDTKILLSFAMPNHGSTFAHWLRDRLMKHYGLYHHKAVYLDSVVARAGATDHAVDFGEREQKGEIAHVSPDKRPHMRSPTGAVPIGARIEAWESLYANAMSEASAMVFVYTSEFPESSHCIKEWNNYIKETKSRTPDRPLRGIILELADAAALVAQGAPNVKRIRAAKTPGGQKGLTWDKGDFVITESAFSELTRAIGKV
jgi:hypothetical protein